MIHHRTPTPDHNSESVQLMEILRAIRLRGHHVSFIPDDLSAPSSYMQLFQAIGLEVIHRPYYRSITGFLVQHGGEFDVAIISPGEIAARHLTIVRRLAPCAKVVFDPVDLQGLCEECDVDIKQDTSLKTTVASRKQTEFAGLGDRTYPWT